MGNHVGLIVINQVGCCLFLFVFWLVLWLVNHVIGGVIYWLISKIVRATEIRELIKILILIEWRLNIYFKIGGPLFISISWIWVIALFFKISLNYDKECIYNLIE